MIHLAKHQRRQLRVPTAVLPQHLSSWQQPVSNMAGSLWAAFEPPECVPVLSVAFSHLTSPGLLLWPLLHVSWPVMRRVSWVFTLPQSYCHSVSWHHLTSSPWPISWTSASQFCDAWPQVRRSFSLSVGWLLQLGMTVRPSHVTRSKSEKWSEG